MFSKKSAFIVFNTAEVIVYIGKWFSFSGMKQKKFKKISAAVVYLKEEKCSSCRLIYNGRMVLKQFDVSGLSSDDRYFITRLIQDKFPEYSDSPKVYRIETAGEISRITTCFIKENELYAIKSALEEQNIILSGCEVMPFRLMDHLKKSSEQFNQSSSTPSYLFYKVSTEPMIIIRSLKKCTKAGAVALIKKNSLLKKAGAILTFNGTADELSDNALSGKSLFRALLSFGKKSYWSGVEHGPLNMPAYRNTISFKKTFLTIGLSFVLAVLLLISFGRYSFIKGRLESQKKEYKTYVHGSNQKTMKEIVKKLTQVESSLKVMQIQTPLLSIMDLIPSPPPGVRLGKLLIKPKEQHYQVEMRISASSYNKCSGFVKKIRSHKKLKNILLVNNIHQDKEKRFSCIIRGEGHYDK